jgi:hypothetical protein
MTTFSRLLLSALVVGCLGVGVSCLRPDWAEAVGLDLWNLPVLEADLQAASARGDDLDSRLVESRERIDTKQQLAEQVAAGQLDLLEAAARFRDLTPETGAVRHYLRVVHHGSNDDERFCRVVISWVCGTVNSWPAAERARLVARLEAELDEYLRRDGRIALPR